ncbi:hypothetical protein P9112_012970 [Eukaryota sp. TZLM1-RC]
MFIKTVVLLAAVALAFARRSEILHMENAPEHVVSPLPSTYLKDSDLPKNFDWRNIDGKNLVTVIRNQHTPQYCGSCWCHASLGIIGDRVKIQRGGAFPDPNLSVQQVLSCSNKYAGSCHGGQPSMLFNYLMKNPAVEETCFPYEATDDQWTQCKFGACYDCHHNLHDYKGSCFAIKNYTKYYVAEHGRVHGELDFMKEIYARGPIEVGICANDDLDNYKGGIFEDHTGDKCLNHVVVLTGWGEENGVKYWVMRNSWGGFWGEEGYAKIKRGVDTLAIERQGWWAVPRVVA